MSVHNKEEHGKPRHTCGIPTSKRVTLLNIGVSTVYATLKCQKKEKRNPPLIFMMVTAQVARELEGISV